MRKASLLLATAAMLGMTMLHAATTIDELTPVFHGGDRHDNVFSRTMAIRAKGFDDTVWRISGSGTYRVSASAAGEQQIHGSFRYDGRPEITGTVAFQQAGAISCYNEKCSPNTDASGLIYNSLQWGTPPGKLRVGQSWTVDIAAPWELGTPGRQIVTVIALDPVSHSVTLKREGHGDGAYADETLRAHIRSGDQTHDVAIEPGRSHWYGYTTFTRGIVTSDELMVERPVILVSKELGRIAGDERQYILLNAMPIPASLP
jgi:hypothetical protein